MRFTSITAAREFHFDANNDQEQTRFAIRRTGTLVDTRQVSQEFRFTGNGGDKLDYQAGLYLFNIATDTTGRNYNGIDAGAFFATNAQYTALDTPAGLPLLQASLNGVLATTYQNPETDSAAVFGQVDWHLAERTTLTLGLRRTRREQDERHRQRRVVSRRLAARARRATRRPTRYAPLSSATSSAGFPANRCTKRLTHGS